jgi:hypothetical protein
MSTIPTSVTEEQFAEHINPFLSKANAQTPTNPVHTVLGGILEHTCHLQNNRL